MSYSLQNTTSLTSLADAIRAKSGETEQMTVEEMITAVNSITTGGGSSSGGTVNVNNVSKWNNTNGRNNQIIDVLWDKITFNLTNDVSLESAFSFYKGNHTDWKDKTIVLSANQGGSIRMNSAFAQSDIKYPPAIIDSRPVSGGIQISYCNNLYSNSKLVKLEDNNVFTSFPLSSANNGRGSIFNGCHYLRSIPNNYFAESCYNYLGTKTGVTNSVNYAMFQECFVLPKIIGCAYHSYANLSAPYSYDVFQSCFSHCYSLHRLTFYMPNGQVGTMNATYQRIDLSDVGYWSSGVSSDYISNYLESDITPIFINSAETATVANLTNENSFGIGVEYSTYTRQSAIETINSLPDTTAAITSAGGNNIIKFKSGAGSAYGELYNMSNLTEEEKAVATAKGWAVELV